MFDSYKRRMLVESQSSRKNMLDFMEKSPSRVEVTLKRTDSTITSVIISSYKEGPDELIMFTYLEDVDTSKNVVVGDLVTDLHKTYIVFEEYRHPNVADYKKHKILECNVLVGYDSKTINGYFLSTGRKFANMLNEELNSSSSINIYENKSIVVLPKDSGITIGKRLILAAQTWKVVNIDSVSSNNNMYLSIELDISNSSIDTATVAGDPIVPIVEGVFTSEVLTPGVDVIIEAGSEHSIITNLGYIRFDSEVDIISQTTTSVTFRTPYDVSSLEVITKDVDPYDLITTNLEMK
jgi:hypothetical protein